VNGSLKAYRVLTWIGILTNVIFALSAFFYPDFLIQRLGGGQADLFEDPWFGNVGLLLLLTAAFYLPVAQDPARYPLFSWIAAWTRVAAAAYWIVYLMTRGADLPAGFRTIWVSDGVIGVLCLLLLRKGLAGVARRT
jgi:hypothetical protein